MVTKGCRFMKFIYSTLRGPSSQNEVKHELLVKEAIFSCRDLRGDL